MKGQEHTVMMYLVWGVFFLATLFLVHSIFRSTVETSAPTPIPVMLDTIRSAINAGETGIGGETCVEVYPSGGIEITKELVERKTGYTGSILFICEASGSCETDGRRYIRIYGKKGTFCAEVEGGRLTVTWR